MLGVNDDEIEAPGAGGVGRDSQVLIAENIHKSYIATQALLQGLSFLLSAGRTPSFIGPNGEGRTATIRILTSILEPSNSQFFVDDISSDYPDKIHHKMGILPESLGFSKRLTYCIDTWLKTYPADGCRPYLLATPTVNKEERVLRS
jgi:ABC-type cobalamin/Fe3+-siderophores transport system ATPase subunit